MLKFKKEKLLSLTKFPLVSEVELIITVNSPINFNSLGTKIINNIDWKHSIVMDILIF